MLSTQKKPTAFESLAGICKFIATQKMSPVFYAKYQHPVEFTCSFLRTLANNYPSLEKAFLSALPLSLSDGALPIQSALSTIQFTEQKLQWFDRQMTEVLRTLVPVVRDEELPSWLAECKWAVEGAFYAE